MITDRELHSATGENAPSFAVDALDIVGGQSAPRTLSFLDDPDYVSAAAGNPNLAALLTTAEIAATIAPESGFVVVEVADPRWSFYTLSNYLTAARPEPPATTIDPTASISPLAFVADRGVRIGPRVVIEPFAAIHPYVGLDEGVIVRSGAVIGCPGFEHKRTSHGVLSVLHDGGIQIGAHTEVGSLANIAQGFARRQTVIGSDVRIDSLTHIAHSCTIGDAVFVAAGVTISGSVTIGSEAWIGPGAVVRDGLEIGEGARVAIGSTVFRDVAPGARVLGNPARPQISG